MTRYSEDGAGVDERVAILEFELRKARENISALRANLTVVTGNVSLECQRKKKSFNLDADTCAGMRLDHMQQLQLWIAEYVHAALAVRQVERVRVLVPRDLVHLEIELLLCAYLHHPGVDERDQVLLVSHSDRVAIRRPRYINVLPSGADVRRALLHSCVPNANRLVSARRG